MPRLSHSTEKEGREKKEKYGRKCKMRERKWETDCLFS